MKTAITLLILFQSFFAFSQMSEITKILNRELENEIKYPMENDGFLNEQIITIVKGFSIDNGVLSLTVKKSLDNGYVIETHKCRLDSIDMISIIDNKIVLEPGDYDFSQNNPVIYEYHYNDGRTRKDSTNKFDFDTHIHFPNKKNVGYELKKAFKKAGKNVALLFHTTLDDTFEDMAAYINTRKAALAEAKAGQ